jgi:hypothetical protein
MQFSCVEPEKQLRSLKTELMALYRGAFPFHVFCSALYPFVVLYATFGLIGPVDEKYGSQANR